VDENKGVWFAALTGVVSGFSIFLNKFAVAESDPFVFTVLKNSLVALAFLAALFLLKEFSAFRAFSRRQWMQLLAIGVVGGSIPFLLYFYALKLTPAVNAAFLHKTLFIWVALLAWFFLKEQISRRFLAAAGLLLAGNVLLFGINVKGFTFYDALILVAVLFWSVENILAKQALNSCRLSPRVVAFARMFFGSLFMLAFLAATDRVKFFAEVTPVQLQWSLLGAAFLFLYQWFWFIGLREARASVATSVLLIGLPITALLSVLFLNKPVSFNEGIGFFLIVAGIALLFGCHWVAPFFKPREVKSLADWHV